MIVELRPEQVGELAFPADETMPVFAAPWEASAFAMVLDGKAADAQFFLPWPASSTRRKTAAQGHTWDENDPHIVCAWHGFEYSIKTERHQTSPPVAVGSIA